MSTLHSDVMMLTCVRQVGSCKMSIFSQYTSKELARRTYERRDIAEKLINQLVDSVSTGQLFEKVGYGQRRASSQEERGVASDASN